MSSGPAREGPRSHFVHRAFHTEHGPRHVFEVLRGEESSRPGRTFLSDRARFWAARPAGDPPVLVPLIDCHLVAFVEGRGDHGHWKIAREGERTRVDYYRFTEQSRATREALESEADRTIDHLLEKLETTDET